MCNSQLKALMKKNLILMKRNLIATACEILFPIILMVLLALVRSLFKVTDSIITIPDDEYIKDNTALYVSNASNNLSKYGIKVNQGL